GYLTINSDGTVSLLTDSEFVESLDTELSDVFLKRSNNLSDLTDNPAARSNLNVYSKSEVYNKSEIDSLSGVEEFVVSDFSTNDDIDDSYSSEITFLKNGKTVTVSAKIWFESSASGEFFTIPSEVGNPLSSIYFSGFSGDDTILCSGDTDGNLTLVNDPSASTRYHFNFSYMIND
ncbi:MAG: hypothetical protein ACOC2U_04735, partial [bacterium]